MKRLVTCYCPVWMNITLFQSSSNFCALLNRRSCWIPLTSQSRKASTGATCLLRVLSSRLCTRIGTQSSGVNTSEARGGFMVITVPLTIEESSKVKQLLEDDLELPVSVEVHPSDDTYCDVD